jgi:hypothetical protein
MASMISFVADMLGYDHANLHTQMITRRPIGRLGEIDNRPAYPRNTLFLNRGDGTYAEIAQFSGVEASEWSWCPVFLDVDLDGYEDLLITTGLEKNLRFADVRREIELLRRQQKLTQTEFLAIRRKFGRLNVPNFAFRNRGDLTFENVSAKWGFDSRQSSHGMALADLDNDGDLDVIVACLNAPPLLYRNESGAPRIAVRLKGRGTNTRGIGARISFSNGAMTQSQELIAGGRYLSCDDAMRAFAASGNPSGRVISVRWRSGLASTITNVVPNQVYEIEEPAAELVQSLKSQVPSPSVAFQDVSALLGYQHHEAPFDDFVRQSLLTRRLTELGPGVTWHDLDRDGRDELIIGTGRGGNLAVFKNHGTRFERVQFPPLTEKSIADIGSVLVWSSDQRSNVLAFTQSHYEAAQRDAVFIFNASSNHASGGAALAGLPSSAGASAVADVDGDGVLELFVAGRVIPGRYPAPASSRIFQNKDGAWRINEKLSKTFENVGLVNGAVFSDLDGDGRPELILACEWGPLKIFRHDRGQLVEWNPIVNARRRSELETRNSKPETLSQLTGWWQGVTTGDFDGDGRMDIVAANWGRNHRYQRFASKPLKIFFGDVEGDGTVEMFEAYQDPRLSKLVPSRHWDTFGFRLPFLQERIHSFEQFSRLGIEEILGEAQPLFDERMANTLDTTVFLNRGDHLETRPLPNEVQFSPAFGVSVADFDGDGHEDIFLSQNFFGVDSETSRYDAGRGLLLLGDGTGNFKAVPGQESGIQIYGEGRGTAVCDYDGDGRADLCVGQNSAETKLYHNETARPGLRVRLIGPNGNASAAGAVMRLIFADGTQGPAREIHIGSGWMSQDSLVQVLTKPEGSKALWVHWAGGRETETLIAPNTREVVVDFTGQSTGR